MPHDAHEFMGLTDVTEEEFREVMEEAARDERRAALLACLASAQSGEELVAMVADVLAFAEERRTA